MPPAERTSWIVPVTLLALVVYAASLFRGLGRLVFLILCATAAVQAALLICVGRRQRRRRRDQALAMIARIGGRVTGRLAEKPERVVELALDRTQVTDADLECLSGFSGLERLDLSQTSVGDAGLEHLAALRSLRELNLSGTTVTDAGLLHLETLPVLRLVDLSFTAISQDGIERLRFLQPGINVLMKCPAGPKAGTLTGS